jgi:hypothetical protein
MAMADQSGWLGQLAGERAWAAELFVGADALLSALKQVHVEAGDAFRFLARELQEAPGARLTLLTVPRREAVTAISYAAIEEAADAVAFFAFVWATLHAGGPIVAAGARVLVSANTWTPEKRKTFSPWRAIDGWIAELGPASAQGRRQIEQLLAREWAIYRELWPQPPAAETWWPSSLRAPARPALPPIRGPHDLRLDLALVRGGFSAAGGSPTRAWLEGLLRRNPGLGIELANLYARYARRVGFTEQSRSCKT